MQTTQLRHLAERAEGRLTRDSPRDKADGTIGAAIMLASLLTPFLREARNHWGLTEQEAAMPRPGDALVPDPTWSWTHGIEIDAPAEEVWPWVVQLGADRAGFYSYQWLENLVHCELRNAEAIHPGWALQVGDGLVLHPTVPPIPIVSVDPGRSLVAFAAPDPQARERGEHWASASWAFVLEPLGPGRCRLVSRFRTAHSRDLPTRLAQGPGLLEPVGFAMDRRMLLGIRERVLASRQRMGHA
jgi:hypothetical protein